jgi:hypothetical protein
MDDLVRPDLTFDRAAIMRAAWRQFRIISGQTGSRTWTWKRKATFADALYLTWVRARNRRLDLIDVRAIASGR